MPVATRGVRGFNGDHNQRLENLGSERFGDAGDVFSAYRASLPAGNGLANASGAVTTNINLAQAPASPSVSTDSSAESGNLSAIGGGGHQFSSVLGASGVSLVGNVAALQAAGLSGQAIQFDKLQMGLGDIFVASQLFAASASTAEGRTEAINSFVLHSQYLAIEGGVVAIDAAATDGNGAGLLALLQALGLQNGAAYGASVSGFMPLDALDDMAALDLLKFARPAYVDFNAGSVQSQDVAALHGDYLQQTHGLTGAGLTIGIMSDSFNTATLTTSNTPLTIHYAQDITSGDLPAGINIIADGSGSAVRDEGRAMAQLIYDMAPGVSMAFATANGGQAVMANNIASLSAVASVVVDDVRYLAEPMFSDGIVAKAVDTAVATGDMYFSSAGNYASNSYESEFRSSGVTITTTGLFTGATATWLLHDFDTGAGVDVGQGFTVGATQASFVLQWDQPFFSVTPGSGGAQSDLAFFVWYDDGDNVIEAGEVFDLNNTGANIGGDPVDSFADSNDAGQLMIGVKVQGSVASTVLPGHIKYQTYSGTVVQTEYFTASGTNYGHANAAGAIAVAAADWFNTPSVGQTILAEPFTSRGNVPIWVDAAGNHLNAPIYRDKVEFTSADGGNTTFFGSDASSDADTFGNFYGTSAAAPNAAAVAILLKQAFPTATGAQIEAALKASALDILNLATGFPSHTVGGATGVGYDALTGHGLIQADRALAALGLILNASTTLGTGQAAIISYETDTSAGGSPDALRFVLLGDLAQGGTIYVTDRAWNGTSFALASAGEGTYAYVAPANMAAGTIITLSAAQLTAAGISLSNAGETVYLYQGGQDVPTRFLFAVDIADGNGTFNGSLVNTGLTAGVNAVAVQFDNASYAGSATQIPQTQLQDIATTSRWHGTDTDDNGGTPNYTEVQDTTVSNTYTNPDMVIIAGMAGGGQSDAILRIGNDEGANVGSHLARLFRDNPAFNHISDISFDLENGFFFFVDSDFVSINRIMRGNIADLVSGVSNPTFTQIFATDGQNNGAGPVMVGEGIPSMEINTTTNKIYWLDGLQTGDFEGGWEVHSINYDGTGLTTIAVIDTENPGGTFGITGIADYAINLTTNTMWIVASSGQIDGFGNATLAQNHLMTVNLGTGAITTVNMGAADPRTTTGGGAYADGRLNPNEGQIIGIDVDQSTGIVYFITQPISASDTSGIWSYNPTTDTLVELWQQPSNNAFNTLQTFPTSNMTYIEVDEIGHRIYISTLSDTDSEFDGTPATNEDDASIFTLAIGAAVGTAPTLFQRVVEVTANGAPVGMEIDYAPVTGVTTAAATYTETAGSPSGAGPVIAPVSAVSVTDADNTVIQGATIAITTGYFSGDTLSITVGGSGIVATIDNTRGLITLTGSATLAQYQTVMASVRFTNAGDNPTNYGANTTRTLSFTTFDGLLNSDPATANIQVVGINDAPVNTVTSPQAASEDTVKTLTGISVGDVDADPLNQNLTVTLTVTHGTITVIGNVSGGVTAGQITNNGTASVTITAPASLINATIAGNGLTYLNTLDFNGVDTLTVLTSDNGNTGTGGALSDSDPVTINIAAVNDAPVVSGDGTEDSATIFEDQPSAVGQTVFSLFNGQYSDAKDNQIPNGGASSPGAFSGIAVVTNNSSAGTGQWQYFSGGVWTDIGTASLAAAKLFGSGTAIRFNPALNYNGPEPTLVVRLIDNSLGFGITDGQVVNISAAGATGGTTAYSTGSVTLGGTVTPVNDAPTSTNLSGDIATYTEGGAAVLLDVGSNLTIADIDSTNFDTGTLTVSITNVVAAQDQLGISAVGGVTFTATTVSVGGIQIATYTGGGAGGGNLVFTFDPDATPAAVQALMRAITYANSDAQDPTSGTRNISWTLVDGDGIANGGADTLTVSSAVNVIGVNDEPSGTDKTATFNEDATYTFAPGDFGFSDVDGDSFIGVRFTTLPGVGTIFVDTDGPGGAAPIAVSAGTIVALSEINAGHVFYVPAANGNGAPYSSFTFQVRDDGGTLNGGVDLDQSPNTFTFNVNSVNDAPTSTNLQGDIATWIEGSSAVLLDVGSNLTIADIDSANFDTGTLTVTLTGGNVAQDGLFIQAVGGVTSTATTVSVGGIQIATYVGGGFGGGNIVFTFDADATPAAVQALMRAISYNNNGGISPTAGVRNVTWSLVDGDGIANGGSDTLINGSTVNVLSINDAPAGTDASYTINEDSTYTFSQASFGYSDVNGDAFAGVVVTTIPVPGTLFYDADGGGAGAPVAVVAGAFISAADIALGKLFYTPVLNGNGVPFSSFTFQVRDNGGTGNGGVDTDQSANTITLNVTAVNDAPSNSVPGSQTINEDASFTLSTGNGNAIQVSDVDATTLSVTLTVSHGTLTLASTGGLTFDAGANGTATMTISGTIAALNTALGSGLTYAPTANYNGPDAIGVSTTDNGQTGTGGVGTDSDSIGITINSVNDAPSGADKTVTGSEDDPYVFTAADFGFTDPIDGNAFNAISIITFPAVGSGKLFLDPDGPGGAAPIDLSTVGSGVFVGIADINAGHLYFLPDPDEFGTNYANFTFKVQDNGGIANGGVDLDPTANTITINIEPDNLPPAVDLDGAAAGINAAVSYTENGAGVSIGSAITVTDPDSGLGDMIEGATVTLTDAVAGDVLAVSGALPPGISALITMPAGQIVVTLSGTASQAAYATALGQILYSSTSDNPTAGGDTARTITVTVTDGTATSAVATSTVTITPVDDAPVAQPDAFTTTENAVLAGSVFPNNGSGPDSDVDGPALSVGAVNGVAANVGTQITLASGAHLTVNADGTFSYDPNGAFNSLPDFVTSGASNTTAPDSFTYTLTGGNTVTVTLTVRGVDSNGDILLGTAGVDTLNGGIGADTMTGFSGNDIFFVDNAGDVVIEAAGGGDDTVRASVSYILATGASVETLTTTNQAGVGVIDLTGNEGDNQIEGNDGVNALTGGAGIDRLFGFGGNDVLNGGAQNDLLDGGAGIDTANFGGALSFADAAITWIVTSSDGTDALQNVEIAVGGGQRNLLVGASGFATIQAAASAALANDVIRLAAGSYNGLVTYDDAGLSVIAQAGAAQNVTYTTAGSDGISIFGANLSDAITTGNGSDLIDGGAGSDYLTGGAGNDVYRVDVGGDVVVEAAGGGYDRIYATGDYTLYAGSEVEVLSTGNDAGTAALALGGNELNNYIIGNEGANILYGKNGFDVLEGRGGNDSYLVDDAGEFIVETAGGGNDRVYASVDYTLNDNASVETLSTDFNAGTANITLGGNNLANTIIGNEGANTLYGKGGADTLIGHGGADTFLFTTLGAGDVDAILDFVSGTDRIALYSGVFTGIGPGTLAAGAFVTGTAAGDSNDRIIYNQATGAIFYDADGNGTGAAIQFASVTPGMVLHASDFVVI